MQKSFEALCRVCRGLAGPVCECGRLATADSNVGLRIYSDDLSRVSLLNVWKDAQDLIVWVEETDLLAKGKLSEIEDIYFTKE